MNTREQLNQYLRGLEQRLRWMVVSKGAAIAAGVALGVTLAANGPAFCAGHDFGDMAGRDLMAMRELLRTCTTLMSDARMMTFDGSAGPMLKAVVDVLAWSVASGMSIVPCRTSVGDSPTSTGTFVLLARKMPASPTPGGCTVPAYGSQ